mgnify:CR=1 FL=1
MSHPVEVSAGAHGTDTNPMPHARLVLEDGAVFEGRSFGHQGPVAGEVVFNTGMVGYPETMTDPSYAGQLVCFTYPLVGNYGVPREHEEHRLSTSYESDTIQVSALIVADYATSWSHWDASGSLGVWCRSHEIPAITGIDTRALTQHLRERGSMLGVLEVDGRSCDTYDPNKENLVSGVSVKEPVLYEGDRETRVVLVDTGAKNNIVHCLLRRGVGVLRVPWDYDFSGERYDGVMLSNGPGDPEMVDATVDTVRVLLARSTPLFGICMGNQLLARAIGAKTYKLPYGHRGQNQPVIECGTNRCFVTSQNHGYAVDHATLPEDWRPWFENLNDGTNEGIRHAWKPFRSVQFHPEAAPGPVDTAFLFDEFVRMLAR